MHGCATHKLLALDGQRHLFNSDTWKEILALYSGTKGILVDEGIADLTRVNALKALSGASVQLQEGETIASSLAFEKGPGGQGNWDRGGFILTTHRLFRLTPAGRRTSVEWAALEDVPTAGVSRQARNRDHLWLAILFPLVAIVVGVMFKSLGDSSAQLAGAFVQVVGAVIGIGFGIAWFMSGGDTKVTVQLGHQTPAIDKVPTAAEQLAMAFVNQLFDLREQRRRQGESG